MLLPFLGAAGDSAARRRDAAELHGQDKRLKEFENIAIVGGCLASETCAAAVSWKSQIHR